MRKLLITALLGGCCAVPLQAGLFIELTGSVTTYLQLEDYSFKPLSTSSVTVSGYCSNPEFCSFTKTDKGFSIQAGSYHASGIDLSFTFDEMPVDIFDGVWHTGSGSGQFSDGYIAPGYSFSAGPLNSARLTLDDYWVPGWEYPGYTLGTRYGVPEPATWAMMLAGFGLAGAALRRRSYRFAFA